MGKHGAGYILAAGLAAGSAWAQEATVEAVQYPAWLQRGGHRVPLMAGTTLEPADAVRTGENARVVLRMGEGSTVKLGANAQFQVERAQARGGIFRATLSVIAGAFRFTSTETRRRDISIKVRNVTAGIRGTDLWGKSTGERDLVCLIDGRISVESAGNPAVTLDQPLDFYQLPRDGKPEVAKVEPGKLEEWARETEISPDGAAARAGGAWRVVAAVFSDRDKALGFSRVLRSRGYPTEVATKEGQFVVQVPGLAGEAEARALMGNLRGVPGVSMPHVREGR